MDGNRAYIGYPHELNSERAHHKAAQALVAKMNWGPQTLVSGGIKGGYAFVMVD
tara:strand:- start:5711 stop:5872 length:162 start_codon:yes stop_codon:yes gene_type:complete